MGDRSRPANAPIRFRTSLRNTIYEVLKRRGWQESDSDTEWDFNWADKEWMRENFDGMRLEEHQRVNHYRNYYELCRKDLLIKNLKRMRKTIERDDQKVNGEDGAKYDFFPHTYVLPQEYGIFVEEFRRLPSATWIMKPIGKSQGKGIFLFTKLSQIQDWKKDHRWQSDKAQAETYIVQRYVDNPYLVGGKKFDLRLYCLVVSYNPLTVYLYRAGFARFSAQRFSMDAMSQLVHLTNIAIQKKEPNSDAYKHSGCKWELDRLKTYMYAKHGLEAVNQLFTEIQNLIVYSLLSVQRVMIQDKHCFELYGYDVLIDDTLKPWLLEVNASPSLSANTPADYDLKFRLLDDMLNIIDMEHANVGSAPEEQIGGFDLIYQNGFIKSNRTASSYLGCNVFVTQRGLKLPRDKRGS